MDPQPKSVVFNAGVITNMIGGILASVLAVLPTTIEALPPPVYALLAIAVAGANGAFIAFKQAQVNTLAEQNRALRCGVDPQDDAK